MANRKLIYCGKCSTGVLFPDATGELSCVCCGWVPRPPETVLARLRQEREAEILRRQIRQLIIQNADKVIVDDAGTGEDGVGHGMPLQTCRVIDKTYGR